MIAAIGHGYGVVDDGKVLRPVQLAVLAVDVFDKDAMFVEYLEKRRSEDPESGIQWVRLVD